MTHTSACGSSMLMSAVNGNGMKLPHDADGSVPNLLLTGLSAMEELHCISQYLPVAGVVVGYHSFRIAPRMPWEGCIPHSHPLGPLLAHCLRWGGVHHGASACAADGCAYIQFSLGTQWVGQSWLRRACVCDAIKDDESFKRKPGPISWVQAQMARMIVVCTTSHFSQSHSAATACRMHSSVYCSIGSSHSRS